MPATLSPDRLVLDPVEYRRLRPARRAELIPLRRRRRIRLGDMLTVEFENEATLLYQVQEMLYVESAGQARPGDAEVAHELAAYERLLPGPGHLAATLFVELDDPRSIRAELSRLAGVQRCLRLEVGGSAVSAVEIPGLDEPDGGPEGTTVSVHMLRFDLDAAQRTAFIDPATPAALVVEHPGYAARADLSGATRDSLAEDLQVG